MGTKKGPSWDQAPHWERHQVGTKSGSKLGLSQSGHKGAKRAKSNPAYLVDRLEFWA